MTRSHRNSGQFLTDRGRWAVVIVFAAALAAVFGTAALDPGPQRLPPHYSLRGQ